MADKPVVLATNAIHPEAEALLSNHASVITAPDTEAETLRRLAADATGIVVRTKLPDDILNGAPNVRAIVRHGVGLDFIPVAAATARGIAVANLPGINAHAVAEYCFAAMLELRRPLASIDATLRRQGWSEGRAIANATSELGGTTLGIVGVGTIGSRVAAMGRNGFGMKVLGNTRSGAVPDGVESTSLETLFASADVIVLNCPLTDETRGLVNRERLALMKADAVLINVSRGPVVDAPALVEALNARTIGGAAIDVYDQQPLAEDSPLFGCPRLLMTPHVAGITAMSNHAMGMGAAQEMVRILQGGEPINLVNPEYRKHQAAIS